MHHNLKTIFDLLKYNMGKSILILSTCMHAKIVFQREQVEELLAQTITFEFWLFTFRESTMLTV